MHSKITSKYQTTIPKEIREKLKLSVSDTLEWIIKDGKILIESSKAPFKKYRGSVHVGAGDVVNDLNQARQSILKSFE